MAFNGIKARPTKERFDEKWEAVTETGCWLWTGIQQRSKQGEAKYYGRMSVKHSDGSWHNANAHRLSWLLHRGPIINGLYVLHKCDVPACVNPNHLYLGTPQQNTNDLIKRGPYSPPPHIQGRECHSAKLTEQKVRDIRKRVVNETQTALAREYSVGLSAINAIVRGRTWKHVA